ncbi:MAG: hypothetical protein ACOX7U_04270 [Desulfitobacteriia bacterium]|jgi:hypothetical protein
MKYFKQWRTKIGLILIIIIALSFLLFKASFYYQIRSYVAMYFYSKIEMKNSVFKEQNINLEIPGGSETKKRDWFPYVLAFNDEKGFSNYLGRDVSLSILYNFGAFNWKSSSSTIFEVDSPYFNSFYGAYVVKENSSGQTFGFQDNGEPNIKEILALAEYDYKYLVLQGLGCPAEKLRMEVLDFDFTQDIEYLDREGWTEINALLLANSVEHRYKGPKRAYIQYGNPRKKEAKQEDFRLIIINGKVYAKYFPEFESTLLFYILSPNMDTIEECEREILSKSRIYKS